MHRNATSATCLKTAETEAKLADSALAETEIGQALQLAEDMGMLYEQGLARLALASLYAASERGDPKEPLKKAIAIFEKMGAEYDLARARQLPVDLDQDSRDRRRTMADKIISKEDRLRQVPLFSELSKKHLTAIARIADMIDVPKGEIMVKEGGRGAQFIMILEGKAKVEKKGEVVNRLSENDFFGEIALIGNRPRTATVTAETDMKVLVVHKNRLADLLKRTPALQKAIAIALCNYIPDTD